MTNANVIKKGRKKEQNKVEGGAGAETTAAAEGAVRKAAEGTAGAGAVRTTAARMEDSKSMFVCVAGRKGWGRGP